MDFLQTQPTWELSFYSMQKLSTLVVYSSFVMLSQHQSIWYTMEKTFFRKKTTTFKLGLRTVGLFTKTGLENARLKMYWKKTDCSFPWYGELWIEVDPYR